MKVHGNHFEDNFGRRLVLRGVNLGGNCKVPASPDGSTGLAAGFYDGEHVSFVGRPFPLDEADGHFGRLAAWGQRFIRLVITWEAIEHAGPGIYDADYLDYIESIVECAARHGISMFVDPHQDVWSRWTGGDGAPLWTLQVAGFEPRNLNASGAALLQQEMGDRFPRMQWFTNHLRLGCATMFTLFFGGNDFAPGLLFNGEPAQDYLQRHYFGAMKQIAGRLAQYPNVIGFDSLNEPGAGFIGIPDVRERKKNADMPGLSPTPWEAICAGEGYPTDSANIGIRGLGMKTTGRVQLGTPGIRAWQEGRNCLWRRVGVWDLVHDVPTLLRPNWFVERIGSSSGKGNGPHGAAAGLSTGDAINEFYLKPFIARFSDEIGGTVHDNHRFAIFIEGFQNDKDPSWKEGSLAILVNATHWYDAMTLTLKRWTGFLAYDQDSGKAI
ncbi:MAG: glycoside hydrolase family 5 protein, partial [Spirochaetaceae bacterium]|nr:glycoside hydrolase family 5 protein [Spirochaetaceae bacterium]